MSESILGWSSQYNLSCISHVNLELIFSCVLCHSRLTVLGRWAQKHDICLCFWCVRFWRCCDLVHQTVESMCDSRTERPTGFKAAVRSSSTKTTQQWCYCESLTRQNLCCTNLYPHEETVFFCVCFIPVQVWVVLEILSAACNYLIRTH